MRLIDRIVQCRLPFIVEDRLTGRRTRLSGAMDAAPELQRCPIRYVFDDDLTRLCVDLAYSRGTSVLACIDLIRMPAERVWVEWNEAPWQEALSEYGFQCADVDPSTAGHRGVLIRSSADGLRGAFRSYWNIGNDDSGVHASAALARFYLDAVDGGARGRPDGCGIARISDREMDPEAVLSRCFHFEFEESWARYYDEANLSVSQYHAIQRHTIGGIAIAVPVLLAFFLLLATRSGLPQRPVGLAPLNRARARKGRPPLLDHVQVGSPILTGCAVPRAGKEQARVRRGPRLHHVRGHLVRRDNQLFWRVPHLRGTATAGVVKSRTVVWRFDAGSAGRVDRDSSGSVP
jgi:hypothetical protein